MVAQRSNNCSNALVSAKASLQHLARDHARVPLSWSTGPHNGFSPADSKAQPWMRPLDDAHVCNAKQQQTDKSSVLAFWKRMLQLRREYADLLVYGEFDDLHEEHEELFVFAKTWRGQKAVTVLNFTDREVEMKLPKEIAGAKRELLVSSVDDVMEGALGSYEGRIYLLS